MNATTNELTLTGLHVTVTAPNGHQEQFRCEGQGWMDAAQEVRRCFSDLGWSVSMRKVWRSGR